MPAAPVAIMAGGIPFNLIGMTLVPPGSVVDKFQDAMVLAREKLAQSYAILSSGRSLTHLQAFVLEYSFNIKLGTQAPVAMTTICNGLKATLDGLRTDGLNICEPDPAITRRLFASLAASMARSIRL